MTDEPTTVVLTAEEVEVIQYLHKAVDQPLMRKLDAVMREHNETNRGQVTVTTNVATLAYMMAFNLHDGGNAPFEDADSAGAALCDYITVMIMHLYGHLEPATPITNH